MDGQILLDQLAEAKERLSQAVRAELLPTRSVAEAQQRRLEISREVGELESLLEASSASGRHSGSGRGVSSFEPDSPDTAVASPRRVGYLQMYSPTHCAHDPQASTSPPAMAVHSIACLHFFTFH
jgi:hypothetical protein